MHKVLRVLAISVVAVCAGALANLVLPSPIGMGVASGLALGLASMWWED